MYIIYCHNHVAASMSYSYVLYYILIFEILALLCSLYLFLLLQLEPVVACYKVDIHIFHFGDHVEF